MRYVTNVCAEWNPVVGCCSCCHRPFGKEVIVTALAELSGLAATDRCDRCGAQAYVRIELASGSDLLFCAHHARQHEDKLREVAISIHDETGRLAETPPIAPAEEY
jgi:hypothetical protein